MRIKNLRTLVSLFLVLSFKNSGVTIWAHTHVPHPHQRRKTPADARNVTPNGFLLVSLVIFCLWSTLNADTCVPGECQAVWTSS